MKSGRRKSVSTKREQVQQRKDGRGRQRIYRRDAGGHSFLPAVEHRRAGADLPPGQPVCDLLGSGERR